MVALRVQPKVIALTLYQQKKMLTVKPDMKQEYDFSEGKRGAVVPNTAGKTRITITINNEILDWFREQVSGGGDYVALMNEALRQHIKQQIGENHGSK